MVKIFAPTQSKYLQQRKTIIFEVAKQINVLEHESPILYIGKAQPQINLVTKQIPRF
jgi:hypothetical protein